jgi:hypothetical protein
LDTHLLRALDAELKNRGNYMKTKENRIDSLKHLFSDTMSVRSKFLLYGQIYDEYATYRFDSAMNYVMKKEKLALRLDDDYYRLDADLDYISLLSTAGLIKEAMDKLESIDRSKITADLLLKYYETSEWAYQKARIYVNDSVFFPEYFDINMAYVDSVYMHLPVNSLRYKTYEGYILKTNSEYAKAEKVLLEVYRQLEVSTRLYAIVTYYLASLYKITENNEKFEEFIIKSAISDQVCALKENLSLQTLAFYLYQEKPDEVERAYQYIQISMDDAKFFNNRVRAVQIGYKLPVIISTYKTKNDLEKRKLKLSIFIVLVLLLLTIVFLMYIFKQMKLLNKNSEELGFLNHQLYEINERLKDANKTKEKYVGFFIGLCSSYVDQMNKYRKIVSRKILANQVDDLLNQTRSPEKTDVLLSEFMQNFDRAFLKLYPTFIEEMNALLDDDQQITLKKEEILNSELRIYALIRLGIQDNSKIASFMRYSVQTVYNKRTKLRNKAKGNREDFESNVMKIGI